MTEVKRTKKSGAGSTELTKQNDPDKPIRWIKTGGGVHRLANGQKIKEGEKFTARPSEISEVFRNIIRPLDELPDEQRLDYLSPEFNVKPAGKDKFNIVDQTGKVKNEKPLSAIEAEKMIEELKQ